MEIAAAVVGAIATIAAGAAQSKLNMLASNRSCGKTEKDDAESMKQEVGFIKALIANNCSAKGLSILQTESIAQLMRLAGDIEDAVDLFDAGKTEGFADEIGRLKTKSVETRDRILIYLKIAEKIASSTPNGTVRYMEIAQGIVGGSAERAADVHRDLQALLDKPGLRDWLVEDLKRLRRTAQGAVVGAQTSQGAAVVPQELQAILDNPDPIHRDWLAENLLNCLLYLCLFPPNHHVRTESLMRRWMAEGLVKEEDVAAKNLHFFIDKSIITPIQTSNNGEVDTCQTTSRMHACISENSMSQNFLLVCDGVTSISKLAEARRLSVYPSANLQLKLHDELPRLWTLAVFPADASVGGAPATLASYEDVLNFSRYRVLRVLDLKECAHLKKKDVDKILDDVIVNNCQVLMKYLSLNLGSAKGISDKIVNLNQLETLDLSGSEILTVFKEVLLLPKLKHLLGKFQFSRREIFRSDSALKKFLTDKSKLETLDGFVTGSRYGFPDLMSLMKSLQKVKIWCNPDASEAKLLVLSSAITEFLHHGNDELQRLRSLSIDFAKCSREFVNTIVPTVGILGSLELRGKLSQFPPFVAGLSEIKELCLCSTGLSWEDIRAKLSKVGGLKYLKLIEDELGPIDIEPAHLRSVKRICFVCVPRLDITIQADALPFLVSLHILCQKLDVISGTGGIEITHMEKLKEVALHPNVDGAIRTQWQQAVDSHPNKPVPILLPIQGP